MRYIQHCCACIAGFGGSRREGINLRQVTIQREARCQQLKRQLDQKQVVLIKAPPESGKTSMLQLFELHLRKQGLQTYWVTCQVPSEGPFDMYRLFKKTHGFFFDQLMAGQQRSRFTQSYRSRHTPNRLLRCCCLHA